MTTGADVIVEARSWLGTPWQHGCALKYVGCDCIGLIGGVASAIGLSDAWFTAASAAFKGYGPQPDPVKLFRGCDEMLDPVHPIENAQIGDVLIMKFETEPMHFAFLSMIDPPYIIHAYARFPRRVIEHRVDDLWQSRVLRAYRLRGVA